MEYKMEHIRLLIVAKAQSYNGVCYIGIDMDRNTLVRPLLKDSPSWLRTDPTMNIGEQHMFCVIQRCPEVIPYPHRRDDIHVEYIGPLLASESRSRYPLQVNAPMHQCSIYHLLYRFHSHRSVSEAFGETTLSIDKGKWYVPEGTNCPSVTVFRCKRSDIKVYSCFSRCDVDSSANGGVTFDLPFTALDKRTLPDDPNDDILIILGLASPLYGNRKYSPRRCYVLIVGFINLSSL